MSKLAKQKNNIFVIHKIDNPQYERISELTLLSKLKISDLYVFKDKNNRDYILPKTDFAFKQINDNIGILYDDLEVNDNDEVRLLEVFYGMYLVENKDRVKGMIPASYIDVYI